MEEEEIEATCKTEWNKQIEEARAQHEEQKEKVREERDVELELTRQHMDHELAEVNSEDTDQYEAVRQVGMGIFTGLSVKFPVKLNYHFIGKNLFTGQSI